MPSSPTSLPKIGRGEKNSFKVYTVLYVFDTSSDALLNNMPTWVRKLSDVLPSFELSGPVYVVGGIVRDALLQQKSRDVDLVVEGFAARELAEKLVPFLKECFGKNSDEIEMNCHDEFGTCSVTIGDVAVDIAQARAETYPHPAALPMVTFADLKTDLRRRDFTINALALELYPNKGTFHDPFSGLADLETKTLRILHDQSFIDDPTRIIRGARLAGRLDAQFESKTKERIPTGLTAEVLEQISPSRIRAELELCLQEAQVLPCCKQLLNIGALESLFAIVDDASFGLIAALDELQQTQAVPDDSYLLALFIGMSDAELKKIVEHYGWSTHYLRVVAMLKEIQENNSLSDAFLKKVNDELYGLKNDAVSTLLQVMSPTLKQQVKHLQNAELRPKITGRDVLDLLALEDGRDASQVGTQVGQVLLAVERARADEIVSNKEEELIFAREFIKQNSLGEG